MKTRRKRITKSVVAARKILECVPAHRNLIAGVDLHKNVLQLELQTADAETVLNVAFSTDRRLVKFILSTLSGHVSLLAFEATAFWYWFADLCIENQIPLALAHPRRMKIISQSVKKCDRIDAYWLCTFARQNYLQPYSPPTKGQRDLRDLVRTREFVKKEIRTIKQKIRSVMLQNDLRTTMKSPFCKSGIRQLHSFELRPVLRSAFDHLLGMLKDLEDRLEKIELQVTQALKGTTGVDTLSSEITGMGPTLATTIVAEIMNIDRFHSANACAAASGIVPATKESAGKQRQAHITKHGPPNLRWALVQAARKMAQYDPVVKAWYQRHRRRKGANCAYVMVAHKLIRYVYMHLSDGLAYEPQKLFPPSKRSKKKQVA